LLVLQAQSQMRTARAAVHRETNAAVGREQARFDLADGGLDQMPIFVLLFFRDGGCQVLDFGQPLADKHHHGHLTDTAHPGIADQLWIKSPESFRLIHIAAGCGLPVDQIALAVDLANSIDKGHELAAVCERAGDLELQIPVWLRNPYSVLFRKQMKQMNALLQQSIPGIALAVFQSRILISSPFLIERHSTVLVAKISAKRLLKAAAKDHGGTGVLLLPAVQIAIAVQTRAAEILANLCVAVDHRSLLSVLWQADCDRPK